MQAIRRLCFINGRGLSPFASRSGQGYRLRGWRIEAFRSYSEDAKVENFSKSTESSQTEVETLKKNLLETERQLGELKNSYLLSLADMENLRQRTKRDIEAASHFAIQRFCKDIISVADVLEMALGSVRRPEKVTDVPSTPVVSSEEAVRQLGDLLDGLSMTMGELHKVFGKHGLSIIDPMHQKFDPNCHNALYEVSTADVDPGTVVAVQKKGYMLNQRVIRPADVGVSRKP